MGAKPPSSQPVSKARQIRPSTHSFLSKLPFASGQFRKNVDQIVKNFKKVRINSREFRKKAGSVAEIFKKRADQFLIIPEKSRFGC
jgi:hypothetical protein